MGLVRFERTSLAVKVRCLNLLAIALSRYILYLILGRGTIAESLRYKTKYLTIQILLCNNKAWLLPFQKKLYKRLVRGVAAPFEDGSFCFCMYQYNPNICSCQQQNRTFVCFYFPIDHLRIKCYYVINIQTVQLNLKPCGIFCQA